MLMFRRREVFFLIGKNEDVLWSDASDSPVRLPDSRARWEAIWSRRDQIVEIAHSHPVGPMAFSLEDETTMRALVTALGRPIMFSVIAPNGMIRRLEPIEEETELTTTIVERASANLNANANANPNANPNANANANANEPWWAALLRLASNSMNGE